MVLLDSLVLGHVKLPSVYDCALHVRTCKCIARMERGKGCKGRAQVVRSANCEFECLKNSRVRSGLKLRPQAAQACRNTSRVCCHCPPSDPRNANC